MLRALNKSKCCVQRWQHWRPAAALAGCLPSFGSSHMRVEVRALIDGLMPAAALAGRPTGFGLQSVAVGALGREQHHQKLWAAPDAGPRCALPAAAAHLLQQRGPLRPTARAGEMSVMLS
eukprot:1160494-Pelagomonas_calceolata.AAC.11